MTARIRARSHFAHAHIDQPRKPLMERIDRAMTWFGVGAAGLASLYFPTQLWGIFGLFAGMSLLATLFLIGLLRGQR
jgi:hypothetical protein